MPTTECTENVLPKATFGNFVRSIFALYAHIIPFVLQKGKKTCEFGKKTSKNLVASVFR